MRTFLLTLKWEARRWLAHYRIFLLCAVPSLLILLVLPAPGAERTFWWYVLLLLHAGATGIPFVVALYMMLVYPTVSLAGYEIMRSNVLEKGRKVSIVYALAVRMGLNALTAGLGVLIFWAMAWGLRPLAAVDLVWLSEALTDLPPFPNLFFTPEDMLFFTVGIPIVFLTVVTVIRLRIKLVTWYHAALFVGYVALSMFVGSSGLGWFPFEMGFRAVASVLLLALCCRVIDRHSDAEVNLI